MADMTGVVLVVRMAVTLVDVKADWRAATTVDRKEPQMVGY